MFSGIHQPARENLK